jgi:diguanylate cyclase (GGDEF)-like protein/PAS domain S-box-containing protein
MTESDVGHHDPEAAGGCRHAGSGGAAVELGAGIAGLDADRVRAICEAVPLAIIAIDPDDRVTLWNAGAERMFAWTRQEMVGRSLPVSLEGSAEDFELVREALRSSRSLVGHEIVRRAADGGQLITSVSTVLLRDARGDPVETIAVIEDLTDRRRTHRELLESEERFHTSVEELLDVFGIFRAIRDDAGRIADFGVDLAKGTARISEAAGASEAGASLFELLRDYETGPLLDDLRRVVETGVPLPARPIVHSPARGDGEGSGRTFEMRAAKLGDGVVAVWQDTTERVAAETELERRNSELTVAGELAELLQAVESPDEVFGLTAGFGARLFRGFSGSLFLRNESGSHLESRATWGEATGEEVFAPNDCWALRRGRRHGSLNDESAPRCPHVRGGSVAFLCVPLVAEGRAIGVFHLVGVDGRRDPSSVPVEALAVSVAEHIGLALTNLRLLESLRRRSIRDPLTGLFNRRYLEETLEREISRAERSGSPISLMVLDIDGFKAFNDTHGHTPGDALMRELSELLQRQTRGGDAACRIGGDEFLLLLPETSFEVAMRRAEELRSEVRAYDFVIGGADVYVTITVGVATFPHHAADMLSLIRAADEAMYRAKRAGGDAVGAAVAPSG